MHSMGRLMDWTAKDNTVNGLLFCATLTSCGRCRTPFAQAGVETPYTDAEAVKPDSRCSCKGHSGKVGGNVRDKSMEPCKCSLTAPHSIGDPPRALQLCFCRRQMN